MTAQCLLESIWTETQPQRDANQKKSFDNYTKIWIDFYGRSSERDPDEWEMRKKFIKERPKGYEVDHIIPLTSRGSHDLSNLQYLRRDLNRWKKGRLFIETTEAPHCLVWINKILERDRDHREFLKDCAKLRVTENGKNYDI